MTGYLIVIAMLIIALTAVLLAFLLDHDEVSAPVDEPVAIPRESESDEVAAAVPAAPVIDDEGTNDDGSTSI
jgi:hypothetical protein